MSDETDLAFARGIVTRLKGRRPQLTTFEARAFADVLTRLIYRIDVMDGVKRSLKAWLEVDE